MSKDVNHFEVSGVVTRIFLRDNFAKVTVEVVGEKTSKIDIVAFKGGVAQFKGVGEGESVKIQGRLAMEKLTNKAREDVKIDGYSRWVPMLVADKLTVETKAATPDDRDPAGW